MAKQLDKTLADYVVGGVMPGLLIGLLVSLCFFLLELAYSGAYLGQMKWILFFFIVGTVLIARISMRGDISDRAGLYGVALAIAAGLAMVRFVDIPKSALDGFGWLIPFSLMSIIWWSAHKLTQDSTWDDEDDDDSGGLLEAHAAEVQEEAALKNKSADWFDKYQARRQEEQRKKKPGIMVIYFSLAALPLFGVGQAMIPATNIEGRRYAFWMLTIYVGCGLGMLLTTSFLGLRRYLRGRRLHMPTSMTALWLGLGAAMILSMMVLSAVLLPRPEAEYHVSQLLGWATSKERDANKTHFFEGSSGKSDDPGSGPQNNKQNNQGSSQGKNQGSQGRANQQGSSSPDGQQGKSGERQNASGQGQGKNDSSGKGGQGQGKQGDGQGKQGGQGQSKSNDGGKSQDSQQGEGSKDGKQGQGSGGNQKTNNQGNGKQGDNKQGSGKDQGKSGDNGKEQQGEGNEKSDKEKQEGREGGNDPEKDGQGKKEQQQAKQEQQNTSGSSNQPPPPPPQQASTPPTPGSWDWLKWLFYGLMLAGVVFALWKWGRQLWDALLQIWREIVAWWQGLLPQKEQGQSASEIPDPESTLPPKPFAWFTNPLDNPSNFRSMDDMIRYSFAALHSWAYEQRMGRKPDETPTEFAQRLGQSFKHAHQDIRKLADLYSVVTYARVNAPNSSETILRNFWQRVATTA